MSKVFWFTVFVICGGLAIWLLDGLKEDRVSSDWLRERKQEAWKAHLMDQAWNWDALRGRKR